MTEHRVTERHVPDSTPYPWPYDGDLSLERLALVVVGWSDGWSRRCEHPGAAIDRIHALADAVDTVVTVAHRPPALGDEGTSTSDRAELPAALSALRPTAAVHAAGIDGFFAGPLEVSLRASGIDHLVLAGLGLEGPVHSTMRSANDRGFECLLAVDACAALVPDLVAPAVSMVEMSGGIFGAVATTEQILTALRPAPLGAVPYQGAST